MSKKREKSYCNVPRYPPDWPFWRIQTLTWDGWPTNPDLGMKRGCSRKTSFRCHQFDPKIRFEPAPFPLWAPPINLQLGRTSLNWDTYIHTYIPTYLHTYIPTYHTLLLPPKGEAMAGRKPGVSWCCRIHCYFSIVSLCCSVSFQSLVLRHFMNVQYTTSR